MLDQLMLEMLISDQLMSDLLVSDLLMLEMLISDQLMLEMLVSDLLVSAHTSSSAASPPSAAAVYMQQDSLIHSFSLAEPTLRLSVSPSDITCCRNCPQISFVWDVTTH